MKIEMWKIGKVKPYEKNPRKCKSSAVDTIAKSIKEFGFQQPLVVDKDGVLIVGHARLRASKKLGLKEVPVVVADNLDEEQVKKYRILDNKTNEISEWDFDLLKQEIEEFNLDFTDFNLDFGFPTNTQSEQMDRNAEWSDMPEFVYEGREKDVKKLIVHFASWEDVNKFALLIGQKIGENTSYIWFPPVERFNEKDHIYE